MFVFPFYFFLPRLVRSSSKQTLCYSHQGRNCLYVQYLRVTLITKNYGDRECMLRLHLFYSQVRETSSRSYRSQRRRDRVPNGSNPRANGCLPRSICPEISRSDVEAAKSQHLKHPVSRETLEPRSSLSARGVNSASLGDDNLFRCKYVCSRALVSC